MRGHNKLYKPLNKFFLIMTKPDEKGITVKKADNMPEWYSQLIIKSQLADYSPIKGCMVLRPYGFAVWQKIVDYFNARL